MTRFETVEDYLADQPEATRALLEEIRAIVHAEAPGVGEKVSYDIATFTVDGRSVAHMAGWSKHVSIYPVPAATDDDPALADDLAAYVAGRGTLHFDLARPLPADLVRRVVRALAAR